MRCNEIREHLIDFVYGESVDSPSNADMQEHLRTCSACREEIEELKSTRKYLQLWKEEPPLRDITRYRQTTVPRQNSRWRYLRYTAIAAMAVIGFMALVNTRISWNRNGFSFSTHLFKQQETPRDYYTKTELRDVLEQALDDTELRVNEANYLMMQKMLDTIEHDQWTYASHNRNNN
jgi:predicted anti-sigma-YlaC factor YlaD